MVTFIAPTFNEQFACYNFIGAMLCQENPAWKAIIYHNGPNNWLKYFISSFGDSRLIYRESEMNTGAWGTYNRIDALNNIVDTEFVVQTSIQDYWLPNTVDVIMQHRENDFIYWNSINHLTGYEKVLESRPEINWIDWGNFAIRTEIARRVGIQHPTEFTADGMFVMDCMGSGLIQKMAKAEQILTIHN